MRIAGVQVITMVGGNWVSSGLVVGKSRCANAAIQPRSVNEVSSSLSALHKSASSRLVQTVKIATCQESGLVLIRGNQGSSKGGGGIYPLPQP